MQIVTDSAADMTQEDIARYNIKVVPLMINFPDLEVAAADIEPDVFYDRLKAMVPAVPTTSQPSVGDFLKVYEDATQSGEDVLSIHVSSGLSGTYSTATGAAQQIKRGKVTVIDTMTLSCGQRFQVLVAAMALNKGWSLDKIGERLSALRQQTEVIYTLETLEYLARGGRIGRVQALAGSLLSVKPIIHVQDDGKYGTVARGRTIAQTIGTIGTHLATRYGTKPVWVSVMHGKFEDKAHILEAELKSKLNIGKMDLLRISPVLGVHTGPGIVGACVAPMEFFTDLM
ncbi:MAG: DegV family protein [Chloroflexota bacterium]|nr:DegV family protein [Chloroflexota bacterium]